MTIDKTSSKSIRLTAVDSDSIRVFTFMVMPTIVLKKWFDQNDNLLISSS
jgi:hypothetical protein